MSGNYVKLSVSLLLVAQSCMYILLCSVYGGDYVLHFFLLKTAVGVAAIRRIVSVGWR